ncbi:MAG: hypothetical protein MJE66_19765 [Proteobacteria bacterium]|nr:hypothetical protein [Pseudomonadota bacterium]
MPRPSRSNLERLRRHLRRWAGEREIELDGGDCAQPATANLLWPLHPESEAELLANEPALLGDDRKPGELARLDSTLAFACNVFEFWRRAGAPVSYPAWLPAGTQLWLEPAGALPTAVAVRLTEPYGGLDDRGTPDLDDDAERWAGLWGCRELARERATHPARWQRLDVGRLLEAAVSLTRRHGPRGFRLLLLWVDCGGREARELRREIDRLRMRIGGEVEFAAAELRQWTALLGSTPAGADWRQALEARYCLPE